MMEAKNLMIRNQEYLNILNLNCGPKVVEALPVMAQNLGDESRRRQIWNDLDMVTLLGISFGF